jgi:hypothetical protein
MDTNSYINSKLEYCKAEEKGYDYLDENIKEFYENYIRALNCIPNINSKNIYIGMWKRLSIDEINSLYEKNLYNKENIDIAFSRSDKIIIAFYNINFSRIFFRYRDSEYEKNIIIDRKLKNKGVDFNTFISNISSSYSFNKNFNVVKPLF